MLMAYGRTSTDSGIRLFHVKSPEAFQIGVHDDRDSMIAYHAMCLFSPQCPDRKIPHRAIVFEHTLYHSVHPLRGENGVQGMSCTIGVPKGKRGIIRARLRGIHFIVSTPITSVRVRHVVGLDKQVIERSIEILLLFVTTSHLYPIKQIVPLPAGLHTNLVEVPSRILFR